MFKHIPVRQAVGMVLPHDITRIVPGEHKGPAFRKGHVIREQDVETLLDIGKEHIYAIDLSGGLIHEDNAAMRIAAAVAGPGLRFDPPCEGRVNLVADGPGLLKVDVPRLTRLNLVNQVVVATAHTNQFVHRGRPVAGTRVVPLVVEEEVLTEVERICAQGGPVVSVAPLRKARVGMVVTGSEVYHGRIEDKFGPVVAKKFAALGSRILDKVLVSDDVDMTREAILDLVARGADMIVCTGGMSVDPDDQTPAAIRAAGARVTAYGSPTFPGAMFLLARLGDVPVLGLPGCVMYFRASIFDLVVPRLLAGDELTHEDIAALGHGGFCAGCAECRYPICPFGKA